MLEVKNYCEFKCYFNISVLYQLKKHKCKHQCINVIKHKTEFPKCMYCTHVFHKCTNDLQFEYRSLLVCKLWNDKHSCTSQDQELNFHAAPKSNNETATPSILTNIHNPVKCLTKKHSLSVLAITNSHRH